MRVGYLGPAGTFSEEALLRSAAPDAVEPVAAARRIHDAVVAVRDGAVDRGAGADRELARGLGQRDARRARRSRRRTSRSSARRCCAVRHCLIAARRARARGRSTTVALAPAGARPVHALPARASCRAPRVRRRDLDRRGRARASPSDARAARGDRHARSPPSSTAATVLREGVEDDADNATRFVWLARAGEARRRDAGARRRARPRSSSGAPAPRAPGWLVRCLREFAFRGRQPHARSSRGRGASGSGDYMFFVDLDGAPRTTPPRRRRASQALRVSTAEVVRASLGSLSRQPR